MNPFVKDNLSFVLKEKKILLGITGSIAAFKACDIIRYLRDCGASVRVVLTDGAQNFVTKTTLETLSGFPVLTGFWTPSETAYTQGTHHIDTARWADLILVAPATAHLIAKAALGLADDLLSTEILAFQGPLCIAPAMNPAMFAHPAVQDNIQRLVSRGVKILGPTQGVTSCGEEGLGRMLEPEEIVEALANCFYSEKKMEESDKKAHAVITLGPTRSAVDPVRFFSNRSSGRMGASLCWALLQTGYRVTAVSGPTDLPFPREEKGSFEFIRIQTAREMADVVLSHWPSANLFIGTAAVLDWDIKNPSSTKFKKDQGIPRIEFEKNPDILASVSQSKNASQYVVGFAAETNEPVLNAKQKLKQKGCDAVFVNDVSKVGQGFESEMNTGWWIQASGEVICLDVCSKPALARRLMNLIHQNWSHKCFLPQQ